ncbi:MAG: ABC transporter ATP-binding protein [Candidatus Cloacimonetes bacterium]|nr:ABC transporter ATP-binding protein [Candidatus Cloacimonadota bacterium]
MVKENKVLEAKNVSKRFGEVQALDKVNFDLNEGEIHGLLGENGAGKTTLMNILYGLFTEDEGEIYIRGERVKINSPLDSIKLGIGMIHQSSTLVPEFTALENLILGTDGNKMSLELKDAEKEIEKFQKDFGLKFPLHTKVKDLPAGLKKKIEIIRAIYRGANILILDEPTTSLVQEEFEKLLESLKKMVAEGVTIVFITHKIKEVIQACDRASVLTGGIMQGTIDTKKATKEDLVQLMFQDAEINITESAIPIINLPDVEKTSEPILKLQNISAQSKEKDGINLDSISLKIYGGEILGIAGISGNGQKELAEVIIDPNNITKGKLILKGKKINGMSTNKVFSRKVSYIPEDRKKESIIGLGNITENVLLGHQREPRFQKKGIIKWDKVTREAKNIIDEFQVKTPNEKKRAGKLSGGNIQRVVIGRALINELDLLVTHSPTAGLDMASVEFVFKRLVELRSKGTAVLYINEDLDELMQVSDRIGVIHEGKIVEIFGQDQFDKYKIGSKMIGG